VSRVDVVIPCYRYAHFLRECVRSVLTQPGVDVRVLILDDASPDDTPRVCAELAAEDGRVQFRRHPQNAGHIATYNEGLLGWASSEYSLLLSADDALAPGALARACRIMDGHPDVGLTYGMALVATDGRLPALTGPASDEHRILPGTTFLERCIVVGNAVQTATAVVRTELQHRVGGYRVDLPHSGDMEMWMRFAVHGRVAVVRAVQGIYRQHGANMSLQYYRQTLSDSVEEIKACDAILDAWGDRFPHAPRWREALLERVSRNACWLAACAFDRGDLEAYRECLAFAERIHPGFRGSKAWWKTRARALAGPALWRTVSAVRRRVQGPRTAPSAPAAGVEPALSGWWPEVR
jgi:glycosyltransferase involved in cell wall biosynthesis